MGGLEYCTVLESGQLCVAARSEYTRNGPGCHNEEIATKEQASSLHFTINLASSCTVTSQAEGSRCSVNQQRLLRTEFSPVKALLL